jgi:hypothetical protein
MVAVVGPHDSPTSPLSLLPCLWAVPSDLLQRISPEVALSERDGKRLQCLLPSEKAGRPSRAHRAQGMTYNEQNTRLQEGSPFLPHDFYGSTLCSPMVP